MIIKIIPENDEERKRIRESEHTGVSDFFVCGNKRDGDGDIIDFHEWSGKYPKLIGPLFYYANFLINEQNVKNNMAKSTEAFTPTASKKPFIKRSNPQDGEVKQLINAEEMGNVMKFNTPPNEAPVIEKIENVVTEELPVEVEKDGDSKNAED